jgi:cyclopropane fatty-acyl-phospholipid synthase-like methyltransferase
MASEDHDSAHLPNDVRQYYDRNTSRFERYGQGGAFVHRAVWGPGVSTSQEAFSYIESLILSELTRFQAAPTVLDLGCGLGASLIYLADRAPIVGEGITISPVQAARAARLVEEAGLAKRVRCRVGNYLALPDDLHDVDLAFSIEAFIHSPNAQDYFGQAAHVLRPAGRLVICDDFLASTSLHEIPARAGRWLDEFRRGWHAGSLISAEQARELGGRVGLKLVGDTDLTPYLRLDHLHDRLLRFAVNFARLARILGRGKYWDAIVGGTALQHALKARVLTYRVLTFDRH